MRVGIDLIELKEIKTKIEKAEFIEHFLNDDEIIYSSLESLAGKIAAKEALVKVGYLTVGKWRQVQILADAGGRPRVYNKMGEQLDFLDVSISHSKNFVIAIALYEKTKNH